VLAGDVSAIADGALRESALVMCVSAKELPRVIRAAQRHGRHSGAVLGRLPWVYWGRLADAVAPAGSRTVWVCLDPAARAASDDVLLARITELRANGLTTKALAKQVAAEFGVPVNRVYALSVAATTAHALRSGES
jgi:hypothetical protein